MLCSLLYQFCVKQPLAREEICSLYDKYKGKRARPSTDELLGLLVQIVRRYFDKVYVVLDALDECTERHILLPTLRDLRSRKTVSLFLTSRNHQDIVAELSNVDIIALSIESCEVAMDVDLFVTQRLEVEPFLRSLSAELKQEITDTLVEGAKGM